MRSRAAAGVVISLFISLPPAFAADVQRDQTSKITTPPQAQADSPIRIQTAPGGGEMFVAGPMLQYVTRGRVQPNGTVMTECGRENVPRPAAPRRGQ